MKTSLKELKGIIENFKVPFKKEMMEMSPYINKEDPFTIFKTNCSKTARDCFNSGKMNDFKYYGIRLKKNFRKKYGYDCIKTGQYVESRDSEENFSGEMTITTIYELYNKKNEKPYYVSCKTVIHFPVLVIEMEQKLRRVIPLTPYVWKTDVYSFDDKKMLMKYSPDTTDRAYSMPAKECDDLIYYDADSTVSSINLSDEEKKADTYLHDTYIYPYCIFYEVE